MSFVGLVIYWALTLIALETTRVGEILTQMLEYYKKI